MTAPSSPLPAVGRPLDDVWIWLPLPVLALVAWQLADTAPHVGTGGLLVLNFMHLAATWTRLYGPERRRWPWLSLVWPAVLIILAASLVAGGLSSWLLLAVFLANIPHIGLQNFGLIRLAERARGQAAAGLDRRLDQLYQAIVPTGLAAWFATRPGADLFDSRALGLDRLPDPLLWAGALVVVGTAGALWGRIAWTTLRGHWPSRTRVMLHLGWGPGALLCFWLLPPELAAVPLAGAHYVQYIVIVRRFHEREARGRANRLGRLHPALWVGLLLLLAPGIPLAVSALVSPWLPGTDVVLGAAASLHHFIADSRIWKLRERRIARALLT